MTFDTPGTTDTTGAPVAADAVEHGAALAVGANGWSSHAAPGVAAVVFADGPHGVRRVADHSTLQIGAAPATCFPTASALASSWDPQLVREVAAAIGAEARAQGVHVLLGPGMNIKRSPLCGRNFEYFSEDPHLTGVMAEVFVDGVQSRGVGACPKHFAANNLELQRMALDARVDARTLREIYLPAFERVVRRARPWAIMTGYNRLNGEYCSESPWLLNKVLREEWGYDGVTVSDWGAVHDRTEALLAGLDVEMPGPRPHSTAALREEAAARPAVATAVLTSADRVAALSRRVERAALAVDLDGHHLLARRAAAASIVLLKNDGALPLPSAGRVAVIGAGATAPRIQGGGSSQVTPTRVDVPLDELRSLAPGVEFEHVEVELDDPGVVVLERALEAAARADRAVVVLTLDEGAEVEGLDRQRLDLGAGQEALARAVCEAQPRTVVVLNNGAPVTGGSWMAAADAIVEMWLGGQAAGGALADVLLGHTNPSGRLAETMPLRLEDTPSFGADVPEHGLIHYGERLHVGYRWYDARQLEVAFPFGHGLSYSEFEYGEPVLEPDATPDDEIAVRVPVRNMSDVDGDDVVQLYVGRPETALPGPPRELKGFAKIHVAAGATVEAVVRVPVADLAQYDAAAGRWWTAPGTYTLWVGASSRDLRRHVEVTVRGDRARDLTQLSTLSEWLEHDVGGQIVRHHLTEWTPLLVSVFGADSHDAGVVAPLAWEWILEMPLETIIDFAQPCPGTSGRAVVRTMLEQVDGARHRREGGSSDGD